VNLSRPEVAPAEGVTEDQIVSISASFARRTKLLALVIALSVLSSGQGAAAPAGSRLTKPELVWLNRTGVAFETISIPESAIAQIWRSKAERTLLLNGDPTLGREAESALNSLARCRSLFATVGTPPTRRRGLEQIYADETAACADWAKGAPWAFTGLLALHAARTRAQVQLADANVVWGLLWINRGDQLGQAAVVLGRQLLP
jgi:hypothetical protein